MNPNKPNPNFSLRPNEQKSSSPNPNNSAKPGTTKVPNPNYVPPESVKKTDK